MGTSKLQGTVPVWQHTHTHTHSFFSRGCQLFLQRQLSQVNILLMLASLFLVNGNAPKTKQKNNKKQKPRRTTIQSNKLDLLRFDCFILVDGHR